MSNVIKFPTRERMQRSVEQAYVAPDNTVDTRAWWQRNQFVRVCIILIRVAVSMVFGALLMASPVLRFIGGLCLLPLLIGCIFWPTTEKIVLFSLGMVVMALFDTVLIALMNWSFPHEPGESF